MAGVADRARSKRGRWVHGAGEPVFFVVEVPRDFVMDLDGGGSSALVATSSEVNVDVLPVHRSMRTCLERSMN